MEINNLKIILLILCILSIFPIIIFLKRQETENNEIYKLINSLNDNMNDELIELKKGNQKIDELEHKILICKKTLKMKLFDKK